MTIGGSIALIVVGAILRFAVTWKGKYVDLQAIGVILMVARRRRSVRGGRAAGVAAARPGGNAGLRGAALHGAADVTQPSGPRS